MVRSYSRENRIESEFRLFFKISLFGTKNSFFGENLEFLNTIFIFDKHFDF